MSLGLSLRVTAEGLARARSVSGRIERVPADTDYTVIVDYAHSPDGIRNILEAVRELAGGRVIIVFGCGGDRDRTKRPIMGRIAGELADYAILTSDNPRTEEPDAIIDMIEPGIRETGAQYERVTDRRAAIRRALDMAGKGDIVLIAGKGHENYQEIMGVRHPFDDREVVREILRGKGVQP
jgi:UDP-N-acetylmuramoyl-L-alanyl-D-glutamate--2,6-diaminopimelate ligase